jgi:hypothetical protein
MSRIPLCLALVAATVVPGCAPTLLQKVDLCYAPAPEKVKSDVCQYLNANFPDALISEPPGELLVEFPVYPGRKSGLFGLGPRWQERLQVRITFSPDPAGGTRAEIHALVEERQNSKFPWIAVEAGERADEKMRPLRLGLQKMRSRYEE